MQRGPPERKGGFRYRHDRPIPVVENLADMVVVEPYSGCNTHENTQATQALHAMAADEHVPLRDIHEVRSETQLGLLPMVSRREADGQKSNAADANTNIVPGMDYSNLVMETVCSRQQFVPPLNFSLVEDGIYRSGFPMPINYPFLKQLGLKTIVYLGDLGEKKEKKEKDVKDVNGEKTEKKPKKDKKDKKDKHSSSEIMDNYKKWIDTTDITFHHLNIELAQEPFLLEEKHQQAQETYTKALQLVLDKRNFPMLIHSNKGKHRIGVLVGLMRKLLQGWCMSGIFEEYEKFAMGKSEFDLEFIEVWQPELSFDEESRPDFLRT